MLHGGVGNGLPALPALTVTAFEGKLSQHIETHRHIGQIPCACFPGIFANPYALYLGRGLFAHIGTHGTPVDGLVCIPVGAVSDTIATPATARFATVAVLLVVGDLAIHLVTV